MAFARVRWGMHGTASFLYMEGVQAAVSIYKIGWGGPSLQEGLPAQVLQTCP